MPDNKCNLSGHKRMPPMITWYALRGACSGGDGDSDVSSDMAEDWPTVLGPSFALPDTDVADVDGLNAAGAVLVCCGELLPLAASRNLQQQESTKMYVTCMEQQSHLTP